MKDVLDYADNPDKTTAPEYLDEDLYAALRYAENDNKTDKKMYVGGINCSKQNAYAEMVSVQKRFGNRGTVVAYHGIQSFDVSEVTPEEAFEIGKETARRMWGDRYQVLVTVHLNTDNIHCHFVVNPVSFKDGYKFKNKIGDHMELRKISDAVCREYGKSVLENADFYKKGKKEYWLHKEGKKTHRDILRENIEYCLTYSAKWEDFLKQLRGLGYEVDTTRMSVKAKGWERAIRLDRLGFTEDKIFARLEKNLFDDEFFWERNLHLPYKPKKFPLEYQMQRLGFTIEHSHNTAVILVDTMFLLLITVITLVSEVADVMLLSPDLRYASNDIKQYQQDYHFLQNNGIHTMSELEEFKQSTSEQISALEHERSLADNVRRRANTPEEIQAAKDRRAEITKQIEPLRKQQKHAEEILEKSPHLYELLKKEHELEKSAQYKQRERSR